MGKNSNKKDYSVNGSDELLDAVEVSEEKEEVVEETPVVEPVKVEVKTKDFKKMSEVEKLKESIKNMNAQLKITKHDLTRANIIGEIKKAEEKIKELETPKLTPVVKDVDAPTIANRKNKRTALLDSPGVLPGNSITTVTF